MILFIITSNEKESLMHWTIEKRAKTSVFLIVLNRTIREKAVFRPLNLTIGNEHTNLFFYCANHKV